MQRYDAVLFDVDGTLIHSRPGIFNCFAYAFRKMGLDPDAIDCSRYLGPPLRGVQPRIYWVSSSQFCASSTGFQGSISSLLP